MPQQRCMEKSGSSERQKQTERCMVSLHVCRSVPGPFVRVVGVAFTCGCGHGF